MLIWYIVEENGNVVTQTAEKVPLWFKTGSGNGWKPTFCEAIKDQRIRLEQAAEMADQNASFAKRELDRFLAVTDVLAWYFVEETGNVATRHAEQVPLWIRTGHESDWKPAISEAAEDQRKHLEQVAEMADQNASFAKQRLDRFLAATAHLREPQEGDPI